MTGNPTFVRKSCASIDSNCGFLHEQSKTVCLKIRQFDGCRHPIFSVADRFGETGLVHGCLHEDMNAFSIASSHQHILNFKVVRITARTKLSGSPQIFSKIKRN